MLVASWPAAWSGALVYGWPMAEGESSITDVIDTTRAETRDELATATERIEGFAKQWREFVQVVEGEVPERESERKRRTLTSHAKLHVRYRVG